MVKIAISGVSGRMGQAIVRALAEDDDEQLRLSAAIHRAGSDVLGVDVGELCGVAKQNVPVCAELGDAEFDVLIDFTCAESTAAHLEHCRRHSKPIVVGTTGFDEAQKHMIHAAAEQIPIVFSPNMSIGVNVCYHLVRQAAVALGGDCDIEIIEAHHRHKLDAPSGTALRMGEIIATELGHELDQCAVYGRAGEGGVRDKNSIGFASLRAGDIVGDHTVMFASEGEQVEISHKASSRMTFAAGAVRAAGWVSQQMPGLYDMQDVLNLHA